ncbi:uncharacterized protein TrAFT101_011629 [Trichoderma asperellum]|uniref:uncharacterized protein n=1 Tax=Trichoderma asperellum TaxID=101201 RepID=UPI003318C365|nr:hypothetical protein TrAFT101_011629 [Trichoderma asperellum]
MASMPYKDITSSPPFTFVVGPDEKEHTIHSALVAHQSEALNALINGGMKESIERRVIWKEISEEVFIDFSQYVYTGDYDGAKPSKREVPGRVAPLRVSPIGDACWIPPHLRKKGKSESSIWTKKRLLWHKFQALDPLPSQDSAPSLGSSAICDYTDVFLSHARMYVFADYYGIDPLQILALHKLLRALILFDDQGGSCGDIIQLVRYSFEQTVDKWDQDDELRSLVCLYAACQVEDLWKDTEFKDIMKTLPDFSTGLITAMLDRLD